MIEPVLLAAAVRALASLGGPGDDLRPHWVTRERAIFLQPQPEPALFVKVYQQASQLEREVDVMRRAAAAGIPVARLVFVSSGPPAVLVTERVDGVPLSSDFPIAAAATGRLLRRFHALGARPPYADGQQRWSAFVRDWAEREIAIALTREALTAEVARRVRAHFMSLGPALDERPCALILSDCQTEHVLIDPATQRVQALLDFVDVQPGDPLIDIAVLTLWDDDLTPLVLRGDGVDADDGLDLLSSYRLLRHLAALNWLVANDAAEYLAPHEEAIARHIRELGLHSDDRG